MKFSIAERRDMVIRDGVCSNAEQRGMLSIHRLGFYYIPQGISDVNLELMRLTDVYFIDHPHSGTITLCAYLCMTEGYSVNVKRVRRLMRLMGLLAVYPSKKLSIGNKAHKNLPLLA
jgi:putative transposase